MSGSAPCSYHEQPGEWLKAVGMSRGRFREEMDDAIECREYYINPLRAALAELPETPTLEAIKREIDAVILSPHKRPRNPMTLFREMMRVQSYAFDYINSHGTKAKMPKAVEVPMGQDDLVAIVPKNLTQKRAMVLLKQIKSNPEKALHTDGCKLLLEGAEGVVLDSKVVRRAMQVLADIYNPMIVYEKIDGSYRLRVNV
jgi:hypothetical protein